MNKLYNNLSRFRYVYSFVMLTAVIIVYAWYYYATELHRIKFEKYNELAAIAKLKVDQISNWRSERIRDANIIADDPFFISAVDKFLKGDKSLGEPIRISLNLEVKEHDFISTALLDSNLNPILVDSNFEFNKNIAITGAIEKKRPSLSDIFMSENSTSLFIDVYIPLYLKTGLNERKVGLLVLRRDPNTTLFPLIQSWPTPSVSSELLLFHTEGNYVVYLNKLRHGDVKPFSLRLPISSENLPAAILARGRTGIVEGIDYRRVPVLADLRKVPDSEWLTVTKVDIEEIYAPLYERLTLIILLSSGTLIVLAVFLAYLWRTRRAKYLTEINENLERINDIFIGFDRDLNFTYLNKHAVKIGYSKEDRGKKLFEAYPAYKEHLLGKKFLEALKTQNNITFESHGVLAASEWFRISLYPSPDGLSVYAKDITAYKNTQLKIEEAQRKTRDVYERIGDMVFGYDKEWNLIYKNKAAIDAGYGFLEINKNIGESMPNKGTVLETWFKKSYKTQKLTEFDYESKSGTDKKYLHYTLYPSEEGLTVFITDLTQFRKTQLELERANKNITEIIESINDPFYALDENWHIVYANQPAYKTLNLTDEIIGKKVLLWEHLPKLQGTAVEKNLRISMQTKQKRVFEQKGIYDTTKVYSIHVYPSEIGLSILIRDITEEKEAKYQLRKALDEKEMLMREVHHRVKNSLQLVISMLNLQLNTSSEESRKHLSDATGRVSSIAALHSKLYQGENFNEVNLKEYITDLVQTFLGSYNKLNFNISYEVDDFCMRIQDAGCLGIIINEMVSNSFKYAFPGKDSGEIKITLKKNDHNAVLSVQDNGVGFGVVTEIKDSLGFLIIKSLAEQLNGELKMENRVGAFSQLSIPI